MDGPMKIRVGYGQLALYLPQFNFVFGDFLCKRSDALRVRLILSARLSEQPAPVRQLSIQAPPSSHQLRLTLRGTEIGDRKSTRLKLQSLRHLVCRLLLEKKKQ